MPARSSDSDEVTAALIIGESLIDLIEDHDADGSTLFRPRFGGSPLNVAVGAARLGADVGFLSAFGADVFGERIRAFLEAEGVRLEGSFSTDHGTCLAIAMNELGHMRFEYVGDFDSLSAIPEVAPSLLRDAVVVHAGSTAFNGEPARGAVLRAFGRSSAFTTMDPNPRPFLIADHEAYVAHLEAVMATVRLVKLSADDIAYLYPGYDVPSAARHIGSLGPEIVIVTAAADDLVLRIGGDLLQVPVPALDPVDTTGAGDAFMAAVIARIARDGRPRDVAAWRDLVEVASEAAALSCLAVGGASAMPTAAEIEARLARRPGAP